MRLAIGFTTMALLAASAAQGQRLEPSRFSHRTHATRLSAPVTFIAQDTSRCEHSGSSFLGQLLGGAVGGAAAAVVFVGISGTYGSYLSDDFSGATFVRLQIVAQAIGAATGAWTAAPRNCREFLPALMGSVIAVPFWTNDWGAIGFPLIGPFVVGIPVQAMGATVAQTVASLILR